MSYPPPPSGTGKPRLRGRIPLRLSLIFGVIGVVLIVIGGAVLANGTSVSSFKRVPLDGKGHRVHLTRTGNYVAYYEGSDIAKSGATPTFRLRILTPSGTDVTVRPYSVSSSLTYDTDGHHGSAAGKFTITKAGNYTVGGSGDDLAANADVALGESFAGALVGGVISLLVGVLLVIVAIVLLIVGIFRRRGHKKQLANPYGGYSGGPPPGQYPPPGGGYPPPGGGYPPPGGGYQPPQPAR